MQQWVLISWEDYDPVVSWIIVRFLLAIASINELTSRYIYFLLSSPQADLDVDVFIDITLGMVVDGNRR